jgi:maltooligosyltrehalose trehalohydrolase
MHEFTVWAPNAKHVTLRVDGADTAMGRGRRGYWHAKVENAGHGSDYGFLLDDDPKVYPDPRSAWQPQGVHGLSRVFDFARFQWTDAGWQPKPLAEAVIYELHVGTFTQEGTFDALIEKLPYLRDLGITHVELMPVASFDGERGWGYDGVQLYAAHRAYGGPEALQRLVNACHANRLAILLDVVYNHFGPTGNYAPSFGPYLTDKHVTPWSEAINLEDAGSQEVRSFLIDNAVHWLRDFHFDGLRLDAVHTMVDRSAYHFLEELADEVAKLGDQLQRPLVLIAESDLNNPRLVTPAEQGGWALDAQWLDDFHHSLWAVLTGEDHAYYHDFGTLKDLAKTLRCAYVYDGQYSEFRKRRHGRPIGDLSAQHFVAYIHNHDQVGNRAVSLRLGQLTDSNKAKIGAAVVLLSPFVPMLFQGEEFEASAPFQYFTDFHDAELANAVTEGRKGEHALPGVRWEDIPEPQDPATMQKSKLPWQELEQPEHAAMLDWYKRLITLRSERLELRDGNLRHIEVRYDEDAKWLWMQRGATLLVCNFSSEDRAVTLPSEGPVLLASAEGIRVTNGCIYLPAESVAVLNATTHQSN